MKEKDALFLNSASFSRIVEFFGRKIHKIFVDSPIDT